MGSMRWVLIAVGASAVFALAAITACGATGEGQFDGPLAPEEAGVDGPPPPVELDDAHPPKSSIVDAGPPVPGTPCTRLGEARWKPCGVCGEQFTLCAKADDDKPTWSPYSACKKEVADGCEPGTVVHEPCDKCGTQTKTCSQSCVFMMSACLGQGVCGAGGTDLWSEGCPTPDTYRKRPCKSDCTYDAFSATCEPPPSFVEVASTLRAVNATITTITAENLAPRLSGVCPTALLSKSINTTYGYIQVRNPLAQTAVVSIYNSVAPGGVPFRTVLATYDGTTVPSTDAARIACVTGPAVSNGNLGLTGDTRFASLDGANAVTIPAKGTIMVYIGGHTPYDPTKPAETTGKVKLNVRTEQLN